MSEGGVGSSKKVRNNMPTQNLGKLIKDGIEGKEKMKRRVDNDQGQ